MKLKAAVIGCGIIGAAEYKHPAFMRPATHAAAFCENPQTELAALVEKDEKKMKSLRVIYPRVPLFRDVTEMMKKIRPDIVSVATPPESHASIVKKVARYRPKAIICEKPIALTTAEAKSMIQACRNRGVYLFVNHQRRFDPLMREVREKIKKFGSLIQGNSYYVRGLYNNGTHLIDLLRFFLGEADKTVAFRNRRTEDWVDLRDDFNADGILFFSSGAQVAIQSLAANDYYLFEIHLFFRQGKISITNAGFAVEYCNPHPSKTSPGYLALDYDRCESRGRPRSMMRSMVKHVVQCVEGKVKAFGTGEDALSALRVILAMQESCRNKGSVTKIENREIW